jgi:hypothetical protein
MGFFSLTPETRAEAAAWIEKARMDLRAARADLQAVPPITGDSLFHCQQAVEKALKSFLAAHERRLQKTHDLEALSIQCLEIAPHLDSTLRGAIFLTPCLTPAHHSVGLRREDAHSHLRAHGTAPR